MRKLTRITVIIGNIALLLAALFVVFNALHDAGASSIAVLVAGLAFLNIRVIWHGPDREEMKLRRDLTKAELRLKLQTIEKEMRNHASGPS